MVSDTLKESAMSPELNRAEEYFSILSGKMKETIFSMIHLFSLL